MNDYAIEQSERLKNIENLLTQLLKVAQGQIRKAPKHSWEIIEDQDRDGSRYTCLRCGVSYGPKITSVKGVIETLMVEECLK
jgi:hypothetical protein